MKIITKDGKQILIFTEDATFGSKRELTDEGYLIIRDCRLARTGILEYRAFELGLTDGDPMRVIRVYRSPEEVFGADSMKSFGLKPATNDHPSQMLDVKNAKQHQVGTISEQIGQDGIYLTATLIFTDKNAIADIDSGKVELSNGYFSDYVWESGVSPDGEKYDAKQTNIRGNHAALVAAGRAGASCKVADSASCSCGGTCSKCKPGGKSMEFTTIQVGDFSIRVAADDAQMLTKFIGDTEAEQKSLEEENEELTTKQKKDAEEKAKMEGEKDQALAEVKTLKDAVPTAKTLDTMVAARHTFGETVKQLDADYDIAGKDETTIKREVVAARYPDLNLDEKDATYIGARFDAMVESNDHGDGKGNLDRALAKNLDENGKEKLSARDAFMQKSNTSANGIGNQED